MSEKFPRNPISPKESAIESETVAAFDQDLVARMPELRHHALFLTRNTADAEDLVQETVRKALEHKASFKAGSNITAWLQTLLKNAFTDSMRRLKIRKKYTESQHSRDGENEAEKYAIPVPGNQEAAVDLKKVVQFMEAGGISEAQRKSIELHALGHTHEEIGKTVGIARETSKTNAARGRLKLKDEFKDLI